MVHRRISRTAVAGGAVAALALGVVGMATPAVAAHDNLRTAQLLPLNNSGTKGVATVRVGSAFINAKVHVEAATPALPHAQHVHFGEQARHECPTVRDDANDDFRLNTAEGVPAYGPIAVSLTTKGNTSDASALAVDRMPVAGRNGNYVYYRTGIRLVPSATESAAEIGAAIRNGQGVVVVHGVDYNGNGKYDMEGAGASELNPALPAEATDPAACGVLRH